MLSHLVQAHHCTSAARDIGYDDGLRFFSGRRRITVEHPNPELKDAGDRLSVGEMKAQILSYH
jgi:hypothetical protein